MKVVGPIDVEYVNEFAIVGAIDEVAQQTPVFIIVSFVYTTLEKVIDTLACGLAGGETYITPALVVKSTLNIIGSKSMTIEVMKLQFSSLHLYGESQIGVYSAGQSLCHP